MENTRSITLMSEKIPFDMTMEDMISLNLSEDGSSLKIEITCFEGAKESKNFVMLSKNSKTEPIFNALNEMLSKC